MLTPEQLSDLQIDALREVGSIGAGHAATALSQLVDHRVDLAAPQLQILPMRELPSVFGGPETLVAAVHARLLGDLGGAMLFAAPRMGSLALVDMMHNRPVGTRKSFGQAEEALFTQVASIMFSAYLASVGRLADLSLLPGTPSFALDMAGAVLQAITSEVGMMGSSAILIRARFFERESPVDMHLLFLPDAESLEVLLGRLGLT